MIANIARGAWAMVIPPLLVAALVAGIEEGSPPLFALLVIGCTSVGALALATAKWEPATRAALTLIYAIVMGFIVFMTAILSACFAHGCH